MAAVELAQIASAWVFMTDGARRVLVSAALQSFRTRSSPDTIEAFLSSLPPQAEGAARDLLLYLEEWK